MLLTWTFFAGKAAAVTPDQKFQIAGQHVTAWLPEQIAGAPVILFSHGFHGCSIQSTFLMEALQRAGYAVFAPNHADAACLNLFEWMRAPEVPFAAPLRWTDKTYAAREDDLKKLLDALPRDPRFAELDWSRVGLAGHSLGGYTALGLAGAWVTWKDARVKAVLALSPYCTPYIDQHTLSGIAVPVMYQGGTHDFDITPYIKKSGGAYDQTPAPKYFVEFEGAGHFAWTDLRGTYHATIDAYSVAFFDTYLKGKPFPPELLEKRKDVSAIRAQARP